ncbi:MAG: hypothetical protein ABIH77_01320 [Pseudomonadota bacterium]|nr:hypothetical protein [Gammaproteobacteria bacterium]
MYAKKQTQTPNNVQGLMWLDIVTSFAKNFPKNDEGAQYILRDPEKIRKTLTSRMSPSQIQKAKNLADRYVKNWKKTEEQNPFPPSSRNIS